MKRKSTTSSSESPASKQVINDPRSISTRASAPGKLILFGEHAVVHSQPAIAASLTDLRITVEARLSPKKLSDTPMAKLEMPHLKPKPLTFTAPTHSLFFQWNFLSTVSQDHNHHDQSETESYLKHLEPPTSKHANEIRTYLQNDHSYLDEMQITAIIPLIYLMNVLLPMVLSPSKSTQDSNDSNNSNTSAIICSDRDINIHISSEGLPVGAGLGSSAAFGVASAAALLKLRSHLTTELSSSSPLSSPSLSSSQTEINNNTSSSTKSLIKPSGDQLDIINNLSFCSETIIHGTPSGIDNAVSTYGGAVYYHKHGQIVDSNDKPSVTMDCIPKLPPLHVILTNTNIPRSTRVLVQGVRDFKKEFPSVMDPVLQAIGGITRTFHTLIENETNDTAAGSSKEEGQQQTKISSLITTNQNLLKTIGVSHSTIDRICSRTAELYSQYHCATKLTGAGGGGCTFTFLEDDNGNAVKNDTNAATPNSIEDKDHCNGHNDDNIEYRIEQVKKAIEQLGVDNGWELKCFTSSVGGSGVLWS